MHASQKYDNKLITHFSLSLSGPSGGGKSSCISMLERFYEPQSGSVLVDGRPLSQYDHTYLHTRMSLVGQEPVLYARSVAENISYNLLGATPEAVEHAAKLANAHDFITAMTDGYKTQTGEKGALYIWHFLCSIIIQIIGSTLADVYRIISFCGYSQLTKIQCSAVLHSPLVALRYSLTSY